MSALLLLLIRLASHPPAENKVNLFDDLKLEGTMPRNGVAVHIAEAVWPKSQNHASHPESKSVRRGG